MVATLSGAVPPLSPPLVVPALPAPPPQPHPPPPVVTKRTWGYVPPPYAARGRPYHPITHCWLDEDGYDNTDDEVDMTNITPGVFTYGNTDSDEEGQTLTTRHALPPQFKIPKLV